MEQYSVCLYYQWLRVAQQLNSAATRNRFTHTHLFYEHKYLISQAVSWDIRLGHNSSVESVSLISLHLVSINMDQNKDLFTQYMCICILP